MKRILIYLFLAGMLFVSCADFLKKEPLNGPSDGTFLSTETEMEMAITDCYSSLWSEFSQLSFPLLFDLATDIGYDRALDDLQIIGQGSADAKNALALQYWQVMYEGIAKCNYMVVNMNRGKDNVPPATYSKIMAEARFLRALYYSYLTELYGGVPLVTEIQSLDNSQVPRNTKSQVVDFILTELTEAADDLPEKNNPLSGRVTKGAAYALKARIALYNERWQDAISASQIVMSMEGSEYIIEDDYAKLFTYDGQSSKEIIFSIQFLKGIYTHPIYRLFGPRNAGAQCNRIPSYQMVDSWECTDGKQIDKSPLYDPKNPFANRDPRLEYTIAIPGSTFLGFQFETHGDSIECWNYLTNKRISNQDAINAYASFTGLCWRKYTNIEDKDGINDCDNNIILMRYAEVLLIYAEAKIKAGQVDASVLEAINKVRQRPSVNMPPITATDPTELFYAVARERKYELAIEGLRLFDIRRWKIAEKVMNMPLLGRMKKSFPNIAPTLNEYGTPDYKNIPIAGAGESADFKMRLVDLRSFNPNRDYLWPIPYIERQTNPLLEQNPNYE
jgi:hypothetical protein